MKSRVLVVEDHPVLSDGLRQLIDKQPDLACVGVADNTSDAKRLVEQCKPDLMLLDLRLKGGDALDLIKTLRVEYPETKVLVLSQYDELIFAERALRAGASGYIMKENATDDVLRAVCKVLAGELYFSERVAAAVVQRTLREKPSPPVPVSSCCPIARCRSFNFSVPHAAHARLLTNFTLAKRPSRPTVKKLSTS